MFSLLGFNKTKILFLFHYLCQYMNKKMSFHSTDEELLRIRRIPLRKHGAYVPLRGRESELFAISADR